MTVTLRRRITVGAVSAALLMSTLTLAPAHAASDAPSAEPSSALPTSFPYQPVLPEPAENPADGSIYRGAIPYHDIAPKLNDWMAQSDIISTQVVTRSTLGRDIYMVTITAPETAAETAQQHAWRDEVKYDAANAAVDEELLAGYKRPIWFNGNIHGNEWEGADITLQHIEWLLENENTAEVQTLLKDYRLYFTITNNPDGRVNSTRATALGLDPNRDFVTNVLPETAVIRDLTAQIQPLFFIDYHGYTNVLQVEPTGPPHGENYDYDLFIPHAYSAALKIEQDVVDAAIEGNTYRDKNTGAISTTLNANSGIKIPYRDTPSGWDDWPPIFTAQYVAFQGAISYTVELPLARVSGNATESARRTKVNTDVGLEVGKSTIEYIQEHDDDLLANQIEIFRRGAAGEPRKLIPTDLNAADFPGPTEWIAEWDAVDALGHTADTAPQIPRAYLIPVGSGQQSDSDAAHLVDFLMSHGVLVRKLTETVTLEDVVYPAGSYLVDMHQPLRGMANALLASGSDISSWISSMYDISAWSQGYLWGATVTPVGATQDTAFDVQSTPIVVADPTSSIPASAGGYLKFTLDGVDDFRGLNALLAEGVKASLVGTNTVVVGGDTTTYAVAAQIADTYGVAVVPATGSELTGADVKPLKKLTIGTVSASTDDRLSLYELGFAPDQLVPLTAADIQSNPAILESVDVIWAAANLTFSGAQAAASAAMQAYLDAGKGIVGRGTGPVTFANTWFSAGIDSRPGVSSGNGIVKLETASTGPLAALGTEYGFIYPAVSFGVSGSGTGVIEQSYAAGNPLIAGHWRGSGNSAPTGAGGRASVVSSTLASGAKVLLFGTSVTFRAHPRGHFSEIATGLYWAAGASTEPALAVPTATSTTLTPSATDSVFGNALSATVKVTTTGSSPSRAGTVEILSGDDVIASGTVNSFGNAAVTLPADLAVGTHDLSANYVPAPGAALTRSVSTPVEVEVAPAATTMGLALSATTVTEGAGDPVEATVTLGYSAGTAPFDGTVTLTSGSTELASAPIDSDTVSIPLPADLTTGTYAIVATYTPASASATAGQSDAVLLTVNAPEVVVPPVPVKLPTALSVKATGSTYGKSSSVTVSVTASGATPTGSVTITTPGFAGRTVTLAGGKATVSLPATLKAGSHAITAAYTPTGNFAPSAGRTTLSVKKAKTTTKLKVSKKKVKRGKTVKVTVTVATPAGTKPAGKVRVTLRGKTIKTVKVKKRVTKVTVRIAKKAKKGRVKVRAVYSGNSNLGGSTSTLVKIRLQ